eukprot:GHVO01040960.1.p1 GENE.GHVO01040960.1~~GHVO01040960.1.p1  ORF type:complete len:157 (+),score=22.87 GHVO01040960.1:40-471(+)
MAKIIIKNETIIPSCSNNNLYSSDKNLMITVVTQKLKHLPVVYECYHRLINCLKNNAVIDYVPSPISDKMRGSIAKNHITRNPSHIGMIVNIASRPSDTNKKSTADVNYRVETYTIKSSHTYVHRLQDIEELISWIPFANKNK